MHNSTSQHSGASDAMPSPEPLLQMAFSFAPERVLNAGLQLDVFSHMARGARSAEEIATAADASPRGIAMLLDAAAVFGLVEKRDGGYELNALSSTYLVRDSRFYMGAMIENPTLWDTWTHLADSVKTGTGQRQLQNQEDATQFFPELIKSLHVLGYYPSTQMAHALNLPRGAHVLDVACGSAVWSIPFAEKDSEARLTLQDFAPVLEHTRGYIEKHGVSERCEFLPGNLREVEFGENKFDAAILGNIVHSEGENSSRELFSKLHRALKPGGKIVIVDMIPNEERTGPPFAIIFALNMLAATKEGSTYTIGEYTDWLQNAGFGNVETLDVGIHSPLVVAVK